MDHFTLGAHEVLELHEVLEETVSAIHQFRLYQPHVQDDDLRTLISTQLTFMLSEYDYLVSLSESISNTKGEVYKRHNPKVDPVYGLDGPHMIYPKPSLPQMTDRDVASGMLQALKSGAVMKKRASLEIASRPLRDALQQASQNCSEQAYEVFLYMNRRGYYQVPILSNQQDVLRQYQYSPESLGFAPRA
ncbi:spore coat protein [Mesobacillus foraminis]|uniref:spore coat protein n=1 Tax=Mesobacillus foraminis TaxID=279826 RepID=UPI0039A2D9FF